MYINVYISGRTWPLISSQLPQFTFEAYLWDPGLFMMLLLPGIIYIPIISLKFKDRKNSGLYEYV